MHLFNDAWQHQWSFPQEDSPGIGDVAFAPFGEAGEPQLLQRSKGAIEEGMDADIVMLDTEDRIDTVLAGGEELVRERRAVPRGPFAPDGLRERA